MRIDPNDTVKNTIDCIFPGAVGPKANPRCCKPALKAPSAGFQSRLCLLYQSVLIDSFSFAHYGTVIKIDFGQLYLLQQERCIFRSCAKHCFLSVFVAEIEEEGQKKTGFPVSQVLYMDCERS